MFIINFQLKKKKKKKQFFLQFYFKTYKLINTLLIKGQLEDYIYCPLKQSAQGFDNVSQTSNLYPQKTPKLYVSQAFDNQPIPQETIEQINIHMQNDPYQNSFLVYDPTRTQEVMNEWNSHLGWIKPRYAVKCNSLKILLRDLDKLDCGFDVASQGELQKLLSLNIDTKKVIYSNPYKDEKNLKFAYENGVRLTVADTIGELEKIKRIAPDMKILWRISVEEQNKAENIISFGAKFGDPINSNEEMNQKFQALFDKGYRLNGIHFHAGSGHNGSNNFQDYLRRARQCMYAAKQIGHPMEILDVGGGFAGNEIGDNLLKPLKYTEKDPLQCQFYGEPGRFIASRLFSMCVRVIAKKQISQNKVAIYINDGIYHAFNKVSTDGVTLNGKKILFKSDNQTQAEKEEENDDDFFEPTNTEQEIQAVIYGHTCDGLDIVASDVIIPASIDIGDWLCFGGMGAYTHSLISQFNSMESCSQILVLEDMLATPNISDLNIQCTVEENLSFEEFEQQQAKQLNQAHRKSKILQPLPRKCSHDIMDFSQQDADYITVPPEYNICNYL